MKSLVILASGKGSNARKIIERLQSTNVEVKILLLSDRKSSGIYAIGNELRVEAEHMPFAEMSSGGLKTKLDGCNPDLIVLAGFLRKIPEDVVTAYPEKIINIHPALLPKYGGKGMYGDHVHQAVFGAGEKESGITIHYVNEEFDKGRIILQARCALDSFESVEGVRSKVQKLEHVYFPYVVQTLIEES